MEERELTQLLHQAADRVTPGSPPLARIVEEGRALRGHRSGRVRVFAVAAAAAAVIGGGSVAAVVLDLPSGGDEAADSAAGQAYEGAGGGADAGSAESAPTGQSGAAEERGTDDGITAADASALLAVTPDVVRPGDTVAVAPWDGSDGAFALPWRLERLTADGWSAEYTLVAGTEAGGPTWAPADEVPVLEERLIPPPVTLVVPPGVAPGEYRICQTVGADDRCGSVTVTG